MTVRYELLSGTLPAGLTLDPDTGKISGDIDFTNLGLGPAWVSPPSGNLGSFDTDEVVSLDPLVVNSLEQSWFNLSTGTLPPGLVLDANTGVISGTVGIVPISPDFQENLNRSAPIWGTSPGRLAELSEGQEYDLQLTATPQFGRTIDYYFVVSGGLPFGLELGMKTGEISGTIFDLYAPGFTVEVPFLPEPVWVTTGGVISTVDEFQAIDLTLAATPAAGRTITRYWLISGVLPPGYSLNQATGRLQGPGAELLITEPPVYLTAEDPVWNTAEGSLASAARGSVVSTSLSASAVAGRSITRYAITSGQMPLGLTLNATTGAITGTLATDPTALPGTYNFTVTAYDNVRNFSSRNFSITTFIQSAISNSEFDTNATGWTGENFTWSNGGVQFTAGNTALTRAFILFPNIDTVPGATYRLTVQYRNQGPGNTSASEAPFGVYRINSNNSVAATLLRPVFAISPTSGPQIYTATFTESGAGVGVRTEVVIWFQAAAGQTLTATVDYVRVERIN